MLMPVELPPPPADVAGVYEAPGRTLRLDRNGDYAINGEYLGEWSVLRVSRRTYLVLRSRERGRERDTCVDVRRPPFPDVIVVGGRRFVRG
jgi:hypothetical protein